MALVRPTLTPFPIFAPSVPPSISTDTTSSTEVHFSRWNNANAEKFIRHQRTQKEIEDDLRRCRRYKSALSIANLPTTLSAPNNCVFKSIGTPSSPSSPSIPGKKSKYSKTPSPGTKPLFTSHPAFRKLKTRPIPRSEEAGEEKREAVDMRVGEEGVSYVVPGAPFEYMYSYTETPKAKPLALREAPMTPFGPETMPRPWTGRKPLPPSKKKLPEFDSFVSPPAKKGVKPVQRPGPFLPGSGPKYVWSRDEVLGEPLSREEVTALVEGCRKSQRQLNMGRDGLTHNMLDNIHSHWKRRRVCKIKCKGVCTVDMDNVCQQLEEKTGGKIIYRRGGVVFLFRGRNYNYKTRPRFPLMLWKPVTPVYPRLIKRVPDGLTLEEASEMRKKGRELTPICKLAKNGVYVSLVADVREAFEACDLVRIDCQGLNPSDYRKIGAKLKDLVPCVLISFENEHVLMWRGREWKSSFSCDNNGDNDATSTISETAVSSFEDQGASSSGSSSETDGQEASPSCSGEVSEPETGVEEGHPYAEDICVGGKKSSPYADDEESSDHENDVTTSAVTVDGTQSTNHGPADRETHNETLDTSNADENKGSTSLESPCMQDVLLLLRQAVEGGSAIILDDGVLDADVVYQRSVSLSQVAPPGPVFRLRPRKVRLNNTETEAGGEEAAQGAVPVVDKKAKEQTRGKNRGKTHTVKGFPVGYGGVIPQGSLGVDELAKLLA